MIRIGTRGSPLALAQARWVAELEQALLEERVDVAVHSAKDVPAELAEGLELVAFPARADPRDAICGSPSLLELPPGARIGTSSLRRTAQLRAMRDDVEIRSVRGNVDTRLGKLQQDDYDALVLALAGLRRLGREPDGILDELVPAAGQGALALEARASDVHVRTCTHALRDGQTTSCVGAERELTQRLGASCNSAVGANARPAGQGDFELQAWVGRSDGSAWICDRLRGEPAGLGSAVAERLLAVGAQGMLG